jgi:V/A-type H+-transporting ATPase subunit I
MPVAPMQKVAIFGHQQVRHQLLKMLQKSGVLEITPLSSPLPPTEEPVKLELQLTELKSALELLEKSAGRKKGFIESFAPFKERVKEENYLNAIRDYNWQEVTSRLDMLETEIANAFNLERKLMGEIELLTPWRNLKIGLDQLTCTRRLCLTTGSCPARSAEKIKLAFENEIVEAQLEITGQTKDRSLLIIVYLAEKEKKVLDLLAKNHFEKTSLPVSERNPEEEISQLEKLLAETRQDIKDYQSEIASFQKHKTKLEYVYDYLNQQYSEFGAVDKLGRTENTFILTGWTPKKEFERLDISLRELSPLLALRAIQPEKNEVIPSLIENRKIFYPFEMITRIFGLPAQNEIDPTGPLSFFYLFFFALCLSDVGYGIILALVSFYYLKTLTLSEGGKKLLLLLFWGGIATVFTGILTGSYFSIDLNLLPQPLGLWAEKLRIIDPIKHPLNVLIFSLAVGVFQNLFGVALAMYWKLKNRDFIPALLDDGLWIYFLLSLVFFVSTSALNSPLTSLFGKMAVAGAIMLILTQGRNEKTMINKILMGVLSLYKTTSYLGDTLSYSRLLALMMTTSIIGMVINILAGLTRGSVPILGYVFMVIILVVGHLFNLVVSVLGAFIHATRLQLVEFFGKFYSGGGKAFKPFQRQTKYVIIE